MKEEPKIAWPGHNQTHLRAAVVAIYSILVSAGWTAARDTQPSSVPAGSNDAFARADTNRDGKLSREEAGDYLVYVVFAARDRNHDGRLTKQEWTQGDSSQVVSFRKRDHNRDDVVTLGEAIVYGRFEGGGTSLIRAADKNRDGKVDRSELQLYLASHGISSD